jgi:hypothetical protein
MCSDSARRHRVGDEHTFGTADRPGVLTAIPPGESSDTVDMYCLTPGQDRKSLPKESVWTAC